MADDRASGDDQETQEQKPDLKPEATHINLKVKAQDGNVVFFKAKKTTAFRKLMQAYCQKASVALDSVAFVFDGNRLRAEQTPDDVDMEDNDEIQVMIHQVGGVVPLGGSFTGWRRHSAQVHS